MEESDRLEDNHVQAAFAGKFQKVTTENTQVQVSTRDLAGIKMEVVFSWAIYWKKTLEELDKDFKSLETRWQETSEARALVTEMEKLKSKNIPITNIVALGIGSLHESGPVNTLAGTRSGEQLAAVNMIRNVLGGI